MRQHHSTRFPLLSLISLALISLALVSCSPPALRIKSNLRELPGGVQVSFTSGQTPLTCGTQVMLDDRLSVGHTRLASSTSTTIDVQILRVELTAPRGGTFTAQIEMHHQGQGADARIGYNRTYHKSDNLNVPTYAQNNFASALQLAEGVLQPDSFQRFHNPLQLRDPTQPMLTDSLDDMTLDLSQVVATQTGVQQFQDAKEGFWTFMGSPPAPTPEAQGLVPVDTFVSACEFETSPVRIKHMFDEVASTTAAMARMMAQGTGTHVDVPTGVHPGKTHPRTWGGLADALRLWAQTHSAHGGSQMDNNAQKEIELQLTATIGSPERALANPDTWVSYTDPNGAKNIDARCLNGEPAVLGVRHNPEGHPAYALVDFAGGATSHDRDEGTGSLNGFLGPDAPPTDDQLPALASEIFEPTGGLALGSTPYDGTAIEGVPAPEWHFLTTPCTQDLGIGANTKNRHQGMLNFVELFQRFAGTLVAGDHPVEQVIVVGEGAGAAQATLAPQVITAQLNGPLLFRKGLAIYQDGNGLVLDAKPGIVPVDTITSGNPLLTLPGHLAEHLDQVAVDEWGFRDLPSTTYHANAQSWSYGNLGSTYQNKASGIPNDFHANSGWADTQQRKIRSTLQDIERYLPLLQGAGLRVQAALGRLSHQSQHGDHDHLAMHALGDPTLLQFTQWANDDSPEKRTALQTAINLGAGLARIEIASTVAGSSAAAAEALALLQENQWILPEDLRKAAQTTAQATAQTIHVASEVTTKFLDALATIQLGIRAVNGDPMAITAIVLTSLDALGFQVPNWVKILTSSLTAQQWADATMNHLFGRAGLAFSPHLAVALAGSADHDWLESAANAAIKYGFLAIQNDLQRRVEHSATELASQFLHKELRFLGAYAGRAISQRFAAGMADLRPAI